MTNRSYFAAVLSLSILVGCRASKPGDFETAAAKEAKQMTIGGKEWTNPTPATLATVRNGAEHFAHHCAVCHGLDGQNTGVPFADKMSPKVADLKDTSVQGYSDGQLKWIIENGIRFTGMPGWKGILDEQEMWSIVRYLRALPPKGSLGDPPMYKEAEEEHEHAAEKEGHPEHHHH